MPMITKEAAQIAAGAFNNSAISFIILRSIGDGVPEGGTIDLKVVLNDRDIVDSVVAPNNDDTLIREALVDISTKVFIEPWPSNSKNSILVRISATDDQRLLTSAFITMICSKIKTALGPFSPKVYPTDTSVDLTDGTTPAVGNATLVLEVLDKIVKTGFDADSLIIEGLPEGLTATAALDASQLKVTVTIGGQATKAIEEETEFGIAIKASAFEDSYMADTASTICTLAPTV